MASRHSGPRTEDLRMDAQEQRAATRRSDDALRVLPIEDSDSDAELTQWRLKSAGFDCKFRRVVTEVEMRQALTAQTPDLILSDFSLPQFDGMSALAIARVEAPGVPFIFLSGTIGEERAIEALKRGAADYVLKTNPMRLGPAIKRALAEAELRRTSEVAERQVARLTCVLQMLSAAAPSTRVFMLTGWGLR